MLRTFIDAVRSGARSEFLARLGLLFLLAALLQQALTLAATYLAQDVGWRATNRLRSDLTRHCLTQDPAFYKPFAPGALMERVDWRAGLVTLLFAGLNLGVLARFRNLAAPHWQESRKRSADLFGFLRERRGITCLAVSNRRAALEAAGILADRLSHSEEFRQLWVGDASWPA